jgi:hypothetical protein
MWKKLEYLCFDTYKGSQPVVIKKLYKLVYVKYNFRIRLRQASMYKREADLFDKL